MIFPPLFANRSLCVVCSTKIWLCTDTCLMIGSIHSLSHIDYKLEGGFKPLLAVYHISNTSTEYSVYMCSITSLIPHL